MLIFSVVPVVFDSAWAIGNRMNCEELFCKRFSKGQLRLFAHKNAFQVE